MNIIKPLETQADWLDQEFGIFVHFGMNTFANKEWSDGSYSPSIYNPTKLNCEQWVTVAKDVGAKYMVLVCKHHDGFCNWQTETTEYSIKNTPYLNGKGDIVKEFVAACRKYDMKIGFYLSPWDRHEPKYQDKEAYDTFYAAQLTELVSKYVKPNELYYMWLDGAGSEGRVYNWPLFMKILHEYHPNVNIFNMGDYTVRWVGNESGYAPYPHTNIIKVNDQERFIPAECDVPIRHRHWFHHSGIWGIIYRMSLFSKKKLVELYDRSIGHGANLLLNIAPTKEGLFNETDIKRVKEFAAEIRRRYSQPIAQTNGKGKELILTLPQESQIRSIIIQENIREGERVKKYGLFIKSNQNWIQVKTIEPNLTIGHKKIDHFITSVITDTIKVVIEDAIAEPIFTNFSAYNY